MPITITSVFNAQQAHKHAIRARTAQERIQKLKQLKSAIERYEPLICDALQTDLRKSAFEAATTEVIFIYSEISYAISHLTAWMRPAKAGKTISALFAKNRLYYEPKGVCLIISPWNYPFQLAMSPLVSAIAAGNCAVLKPSELSPATSGMISKIAADCFDKEEVYCFEGGAETASELLKLPFDHIFFTGSTAVGKLVMEAAAKNLSAVTLELGGKSPVIIDASANLKNAARKIAWGKLINAGQTCIAPDYLLIPEQLLEDFLGHYKKAVEVLFYGGAAGPDLSVYPKIINERHFKRLCGLIDQAADHGAVLAYGGQRDKKTMTISPTVLLDAPSDSAVMQQEIFGPILPIVTYKNVDEALMLIKRNGNPLALYVFSENNDAVKHIIHHTSSGGICINDVLVHISNPKLPFGGVGASGMGSCHGHYGFKAFSHERAVMFQSRLGMTSLIYPPYEGKSRLLKWLKRLL